MAKVTKDLIHLESVGLIKLAQTHPELEFIFRHALVQDVAYGAGAWRRRLSQVPRAMRDDNKYRH